MDRPSGPLNPELLHRHAPGLRALVRTLVLDDNRVEDIVQETWLAALKRPPQQEEKAGAWLAVVARRIVQRGRREHARRVQREERAAKPEGLPSAEEIVSRELARRELVDVVLELDEPYRTAILLRYFEGMAPQDIADRLKAPLETVRTRLKRGLERLREKLDRKHDGDSKRWHLALLPLAQLPLGPLVPQIPFAGEELVSAGAQTSTAASFSFGMLATALGVSVVVGLSWFVFRTNSDVDQASSSHADLTRLDPARNEAPPDPAVRRTDERTDLAELRLLHFRERTSGAPHAALPLAAADVPWAGSPHLGWQRRSWARGEGAEDDAPYFVSLGASDASGTLAVARDQGALFPVVTDPHWSFALPPDVIGRQSDFVVERAGVLRGRVHAESAAARDAMAQGNAIVRLVPTGTRDGRVRIGLWDALRGARGAHPSARGEFEFGALPLDLVYRIEVFAPTVGLTTVAGVEFDLPSTPERQIDLVWTSGGAAVQGYVSGVEGFPIGNATLSLFHLGSMSEDWESRRGEDSFGPLELARIAVTECDSSGLFAFQPLPDGRYRIEARADGFDLAQRHIEIQDGATAPLSLRLELAGALEGEVRDGAGAPIVDAFVAARQRGGEQFTRTDAAGRFRFDALRGGAWDIQVWREGFGAAERRVELLRGERSWLGLELEPSAPTAQAEAPRRVDLRMRLVENGTNRGIVGALIEVDPWRSRGADRTPGKAIPPPRAVLSDAQGYFEVPNLSMGRVALKIRCAGFGEVQRELDLSADLTTQMLALDPSGSLSGVLRDRSGEALAHRQIYVRGSGSRVVETDAEGRYFVSDLAAGKWSLAVPSSSSNWEAERGGETLSEVSIRAGEAQTEDLTIDLLPTGRSTLIVQSQLEAGSPLLLIGAEQALARILRPGRVDRAQAARFEALPSGRYRMQVGAADGVLRLLEFEVAGEETLLSIPAVGEQLLRLAARSGEGETLELVSLRVVVSAGTSSAGRGQPRGAWSGGGRRKEAGEQPITAIAYGGGAWTLEGFARNSSGQLFRGQIELSAAVAAGAAEGGIAISCEALAPDAELPAPKRSLRRENKGR